MESIASLSNQDREAIRAIPGTLRQLDRNQDIIREGDRPNTCCMIQEGFVCRYKLAPDGKRQIMSFHIPGDVPDVLSLFIATMDHGLCTLAPTLLVEIAHEDMLRVFDRYPNLARLFWRDTLIDAAIFREWMVGLGRREAYARLARMLCEVVTRMRVMGLTRGNICDLPLTQADIGDATGISFVHVNRTLQELRGDGLIAFQGGCLEVLDWDGLQKAGDFDPGYLHLHQRAA